VKKGGNPLQSSWNKTAENPNKKSKEWVLKFAQIEYNQYFLNIKAKYIDANFGEIRPGYGGTRKTCKINGKLCFSSPFSAKKSCQKQ